MIRKRRLPRTRIVTRGLAALLAVVFVVPVVPAAAQQPLTAQSVSMTVLSVTPATPTASTEPRDLTVVLRLVNTTDETLSAVTIDGTRGVPIETQQALDDAIAHPVAPDPSLQLSVAIPTKDRKPVTTPLSARGAQTVTFTTTSSIIDDDTGVCICANQIYPLYFTAHTTDVSGADVTVGSTQTYLPAFFKPDEVQPVQVSWLWPIIDRPHRLLDDQAPGRPPVFLDDDLAREVTTGRLSRVADVLSTVAGQVAMTVVIDPELIDELAVMAAGPYQVSDGKKTVAGVGSQAAESWLEQLRDALAEPGIEVSYTPYADPDIQSLVNVGLDWNRSLSTTAQARVDVALGHPADGGVWWPVDESLDQSALAAVVSHGASAVVLNDRTLPSNQQPTGNGLATVQTANGPISAVVTSNSIEHYVASALSTTGRGRATLPLLVAELAVRATESPDAGSYVAITPPRNIDPDPANAADTILATAHAIWAKGRTVSSAVATVQPSDRGPLVPPRSSGELASTAIASARQLTQSIPSLASMFSQQDANRLLGSLPAGVQRAESADWRYDPDPAAGAVFADRLSERITSLTSGVRIASPPGGRYTLASDNSPLPLTVVNDLDVNVTVSVEITPQNNLPGFTARPIQRQVITAHSTLTLHIPTHVDRTGRFAVIAQLFTPTGRQPVGSSVALSVHSTGLGLIGVIITVVAGAILALALVIRFIRRWRGRGRPTPPTGPTRRIEPQSVPA